MGLMVGFSGVLDGPIASSLAPTVVMGFTKLMFHLIQCGSQPAGDGDL
jgi:hypothetical protein